MPHHAFPGITQYPLGILSSIINISLNHITDHIHTWAHIPTQTYTPHVSYAFIHIQQTTTHTLVPTTVTVTTTRWSQSITMLMITNQSHPYFPHPHPGMHPGPRMLWNALECTGYYTALTPAGNSRQPCLRIHPPLQSPHDAYHGAHPIRSSPPISSHGNHMHHLASTPTTQWSHHATHIIDNTYHLMSTITDTTTTTRNPHHPSYYPYQHHHDHPVILRDWCPIIITFPPPIPRASTPLDWCILYYTHTCREFKAIMLYRILTCQSIHSRWPPRGPHPIQSSIHTASTRLFSSNFSFIYPTRHSTQHHNLIEHIGYLSIIVSKHDHNQHTITHLTTHSLLHQSTHL